MPGEFTRTPGEMGATIGPDGQPIQVAPNVLDVDGTHTEKRTVTGPDGNPVTIQVIVSPNGNARIDFNDPVTRAATDAQVAAGLKGTSDGSGALLPQAGAGKQTNGDASDIVGNAVAPFVPLIHGDVDFGASGSNAGSYFDHAGNKIQDAKTAAAGAAGGSGGSGGGVVDAVNGVAQEAFKYADQNRDFQLGGLDKANAALDPAKASYADMYGPGGTLTGPGQGETAFADKGGNLIGQTEQSKVLASASPFLSGQSPGMSAYKDVAGQLSGPTLSGQTYGSYASQLGQPSAGEQRYADTAGKYDTNALDKAAPGLNSKLDAKTNLEGSLGDIAGKYAAPSASSQTYKAQSGQLAGPGALEQFAASDMAGTNPYYKQLGDQQAADIDASMNARGGFNSGAALKAQALGRSNLAAQQYQQEGQLQGAAQTAAMSRLGQQQSAAGAADTSTYAGLAGQTSALSAADAQRLARTQSGIDLAGTQASTDLGYLQGGQQAANSAGAASLARTNAGIDLTRGTDATNLAQNLGYTGAANAAGAGQVSQYNALAGIAQGQDATNQAQYMNYLSSAASAQQASQDRQQQGFTDAAGTGALEAANTTGQYGKAGDEYASMVSAGMGAQLNAAQLAAQQAMNQQNNTYGLYTAGIKALLS